MVNVGVEELPLTRHFPGLVRSVWDVQHLKRFVSMRSTILDRVWGCWGRSRRGKKAPEVIDADDDDDGGEGGTSPKKGK